jgi:hypothetical protein
MVINALVKRLLVIVVATLVVAASEAYAQGPGQPQQPADTISLSGPRAGVTFLSPGVRNQISEDFNHDLGPAITQFGWQFEKRFMTSETGATGVTEWVLLFGGADQGVFIPSLSWLLGLRTIGGIEFAAGPNLSPAGVAVAFAAGVTLRAGNLNVPFNIAVVPSESGARVSFLMGFNSKRR